MHESDPSHMSPTHLCVPPLQHFRKDVRTCWVSRRPCWESSTKAGDLQTSRHFICARGPMPTACGPAAALGCMVRIPESGFCPMHVVTPVLMYEAVRYRNLGSGRALAGSSRLQRKSSSFENRIRRAIAIRLPRYD